jgi:type II secretory pathway pseudopilin PulG
MKRAGIILIVGILLIGAAYVAGFWPQYQKARQAQRQLAGVTDELNQAQSKLRLCRLQNRLLALIGKASSNNFGQASPLSTEFFNQVREEASRRSEPQIKAALESILQQRDVVTADLAKGDPASVSVLNRLEGTMFTLVDNALKETGEGAPAAPAAPAG